MASQSPCAGADAAVAHAGAKSPESGKCLAGAGTNSEMEGIEVERE